MYSNFVNRTKTQALGYLLLCEYGEMQQQNNDRTKQLAMAGAAGAAGGLLATSQAGKNFLNNSYNGLKSLTQQQNQQQNNNPQNQQQHNNTPNQQQNNNPQNQQQSTPTGNQDVLTKRADGSSERYDLNYLPGVRANPNSFLKDQTYGPKLNMPKIDTPQLTGNIPEPPKPVGLHARTDAFTGGPITKTNFSQNLLPSSQTSNIPMIKSSPDLDIA